MPTPLARSHQRRQIPPGHPNLALPAHHTNLPTFTTQNVTARRRIRHSVIVMQRRHQHSAEPAADFAVLKLAEVEQRLVGTDIADGDNVFMEVVGVAEAEGLLLVRLQSLKQGLGIGGADQPGEVMGDEPGLVVDHQGAQALGVVIEDERGVCVVHGGTPAE
jgi:hypothetical protein